MFRKCFDQTCKNWTGSIFCLCRRFWMLMITQHIWYGRTDFSIFRGFFNHRSNILVRFCKKLIRRKGYMSSLTSDLNALMCSTTQNLFPLEIFKGLARARYQNFGALCQNHIKHRRIESESLYNQTTRCLKSPNETMLIRNLQKMIKPIHRKADTCETNRRYGVPNTGTKTGKPDNYKKLAVRLLLYHVLCLSFELKTARKWFLLVKKVFVRSMPVHVENLERLVLGENNFRCRPQKYLISIVLGLQWNIWASLGEFPKYFRKTLHWCWKCK